MLGRVHGPTDRPRPLENSEFHLRLQRHNLPGRRIENCVRTVERVSTGLFIVALPLSPQSIDHRMVQHECRVLWGRKEILQGRAETEVTAAVGA